MLEPLLCIFSQPIHAHFIMKQCTKIDKVAKKKFSTASCKRLYDNPSARLFSNELLETKSLLQDTNSYILKKKISPSC